MSRVEVRPFEAADLAACGTLLAERHRQHRIAEPLLSPRFEDADAAIAELTTAFEGAGASGAVAFRAGDLVGFVLGAPKSSPLWGPNIWVEAAGQAATDAEVMRDLYAFAATSWVAEGHTAHYVMVPAHDAELVHAWFRLGFGQQHAHAIRPASRPATSMVPRLSVRRAIRADIPALAQLDLELPMHQGLSPTFSPGKIGTVEENLADWTEDFDDDGYVTFVAEHDGEVIGSAIGCALEKSSAHLGPARPDNAGFLGFAAVFPQARGAGAGRALGEAIIDWAAASGFDSVVTDWRVTNLLSSRTWPKLGFTETFLRLHRMIGY
ncbi:GNAT family N-acetyltransferase [Micromonospora polyrhachis]|uniref:GNAT superfamily N-acetyltransferase n=1 Tax=Micromonospora polyrhachis TaxID=1282883 RepID=A0A7W7SPL1_9ACTN|nr:GNAT family N-acetyltransferase [Micromonospora polyrhachis]MBB4958461.1 GNAT superfamily N-acetyltransferase [Micromonospora polyrhachis]